MGEREIRKGEEEVRREGKRERRAGGERKLGWERGKKRR